MDYIEDKDLIVIYSKKMGLETLANKLADLNADQVSGFFHNRNIKIPRKMNVLALFGALNDRIKELDSKSLSRDGFTKLQNYANFSEYLLENLFVKVGTDDNFKTYRKYLWMLLLRNYKELKLLDGEVQYLINVRKQKMESCEEFFNYINASSMDLKSEFDGIPQSCIEPLLKECYSQDDIRRLAFKYDISIPNRLKKEELLEYVKQILDSKRKLTKTLEKEITGMTVVQLNSFCKLHQIELSANLKKNELIFLFLFLLNLQDVEKMNDVDLIGYDWCVPLEFSVDLTAIDTFGRGEAKKVIILKDEPVEEEKPTTKPDSIIPIRVEGVDVLLDLEHGTVLPDNSSNFKPNNIEQKPTEEPIEEEPTEAPVEEEPTEEPVEEESTEEPVEEEPTDEPVEEEPTDEPVEEESTEEPVEEESTEEAVEEEPTEEAVEEEPIEEPVEEEPIEESVEEEPTEEPVEEEPTEEPVEEESPEEPVEEEPTEEPVEEESTEEPVEEESTEEPVEEEPTEEPVEEESTEEPVEEEPTEEAVEEESTEEAVEEEPTEEPVEEEPTGAPVEEEKPELQNESYDEEFQDEQNSEPEEMNEPGKESPYFRNKKLLSKKKQIIVACSVVGGVIAFVVLGFALLYLLG